MIPVDKCPRCGHEEPSTADFAIYQERVRWIWALRYGLDLERRLTLAELNYLDGLLRTYRERNAVPGAGDHP